MVAGIVEHPGGEPYGTSMEARVAVLESIAAQTSATLAEIRQEMREMRTEMRTEFHDLRRIHERDFRITFGAIITTTVGLAALIAHVAHWI